MIGIIDKKTINKEVSNVPITILERTIKAVIQNIKNCITGICKDLLLRYPPINPKNINKRKGSCTLSGIKYNTMHIPINNNGPTSLYFIFKAIIIVNNLEFYGLLYTKNTLI